MGERSVHYGNGPIIESPILARKHRNGKETVAPMKTEAKTMTDYFPKVSRNTNKLMDDDRISKGTVETSKADNLTVHDTLKLIFGRLDHCWKDLESSLMTPNTFDSNPDVDIFKEGRILMAVSNQSPKPLNTNSKLKDIQTAIDNWSNNMSRKRVMELKDLFDEECNIIRDLCNHCWTCYDEANKIVNMTFRNGRNPWAEIIHNVATIRNQLEFLYQTLLKTESLSAQETKHVTLNKVKVLGQTIQDFGEAERSRAGKIEMKSRLQHSSVLEGPPHTGNKGTMKRRRSSSTETNEEKRKRSRSAIPFKFQSMDASTTAVATSGADSVGMIPKINRNSQRSKKAAPIQQRAVDDGFDKFAHSFVIEDDDPQRLHNPLLELPQYLGQGQSRLDAAPQAAELLAYMSLYFPQPDTYPLSYYARLLGFDLSTSLASADNFHNLDAETIPLMDNTNDVWYQIPDLGPMSNNPSGRSNSLADERRLDQQDPVLKRLLEDLMLSHSNLFQETSQTTTISPECVTFAREQGIISDDIEFRSLKSGDEAFLSIGDDMIQPGNQVFEPYVRSQGNNIIQAVSKSRNVPVGFIRYSFVWYKISRSIKNQSLDAEADASYSSTSELIIRIKNLKGQGFLNDGDSSSALVLLALALEHARRLHVWYGILDSVNAECTSFFSRYFRMKHIHATLSGNVQISDHTMFLNLHRLNYNYSIAHWLECHTKDSKAENRLNSHQERMIVRLHRPLVTETNHHHGLSPHISYQHEPKENWHGNVTVRLTLKTEGGPLEKSDVFIECLDNNTGLLVGDRGDLPAESNVDRLSKTADQMNGDDFSFSKTRSTINAPLCWEVLKCFPTTVNSDSNVDNQLPNQNDDYLAQQLIRKQRELLELETSLVPTLRFLFGSVCKEREHFEKHESGRKIRENETIAQYESLMKRQREVTMVKDSQLEIDMDAVCDVCNDGDVTPCNQIIFCDSCNVAVHQNCYGIASVPDGDFFCEACKYLKPQDGREDKKPPDIFCELCPSRGGAFYRAHQLDNQVNGKSVTAAKWAHVVCAKWQGIDFFMKNEKVLEDLTETKKQFIGLSCCICLGERGTYNKCRYESCRNWMHVTCARASGSCNIVHGENHEGAIDINAWTLSCPKHSKLDPSYVVQPDAIQKLRNVAQSLPPEPKDFISMTYEEREKYLEDVENEKNLFLSVVNRPTFYRCEVCDSFMSGDDQLLICSLCNVSFHGDCFSGWREGTSDDGKSIITCDACIYKTNNRDNDKCEEPKCHMCPSSKGLLVKASAEFQGKKSIWKNNNGSWKPEYYRSLFGKQIWCHFICAIWHDSVAMVDNVADCTNVIMNDGLSHINAQKSCQLCGRKDKVKAQCRTCRLYVHVTCARQAGFVFKDGNGDDDDDDKVQFSIYCTACSGYENVFRGLARRILKLNRGETYDDIAMIYDLGITLIRNLGWAWAWADRWVGKNVDRAKDVRRCRLAAFGAALRNRNYDNESGDDNRPLICALQSILRARSLAGILKSNEIEMISTWLARIYRTKSQLLALGNDSVSVATTYENDSPVFTNTKQPRFLLGTRSLPGKTMTETDNNDLQYKMDVTVTSPSPSKMTKGKNPVSTISNKATTLSAQERSDKMATLRRTKDISSITSSLAVEVSCNQAAVVHNVRVSISGRPFRTEPLSAFVQRDDPIVRVSSEEVNKSKIKASMKERDTASMETIAVSGPVNMLYTKDPAKLDAVARLTRGRDMVDQAPLSAALSVDKKRKGVDFDSNNQALKMLRRDKGFDGRKRGRPAKIVKRSSDRVHSSTMIKSSNPNHESKRGSDAERNEEERLTPKEIETDKKCEADALFDMDKPIPKKKVIL